METLNIAPVVSNEQPSAANSKKATGKQKQTRSDVSKTVVVYEYHSKDAITEHKFDFSLFTKAIGEIVKTCEGRCEFKYLGKSFEIPASRESNDNSSRAAKAYRQLVTAIFPKGSDMATEVSATSEEGKVLIQLKDKGFKFKTLCKAQVFRAVVKNEQKWKAIVKHHFAVVDRLYANDTREVKALNDKTKLLRAETLGIITGVPVKQVKVITAKK